MFFSANVLMARAPQDWVDFSKIENANQKKKILLKDADITFTNEDLDKKFKDPRILPINFDIEGRSLPMRSGKVLEKFSKGNYIKVLFRSHDKRWVAVESMKTSKKRWIPKSAIPDFEDKILEQKPTTSTEEE
jgi:hypothetical protein